MGKHEIRLCEHLVTSYYGPASGVRSQPHRSCEPTLTNRRASMSPRSCSTAAGCPSCRLSSSPACPSRRSAQPSSCSSSNSPSFPLRILIPKLTLDESCVYHSFVGDPSPSSQPEHFEANIPEMLARIRFGKYVALALECFGQEGKEIVEVLLVEGMAKVKQVEEGLASGEDPKSTSSPSSRRPSPAL